MKKSKPRTFYVETFGCQMNVADSEEMSAELLRRGFSPTSDKEEADVVLLNTCTVRQHAEQRALSFIGRLKDWKRKRPGRAVIVAGCAAERLKKNLKTRFPQVDLVAGAKSIEQFPDLLESFFAARPAAPAAEKSPGAPGYDWFKESESAFGQGELRSEGPPMVLGHPEDTAFVTIMRGCNYSCSYCVVPAVRGREIYRPADTIATEVRRKAEAGARKLMLLGQTVNSYWHRRDSSDGGSELIDFAALLRQVSEIPGIEEIRFMSPHPHYMSGPLIQTLGKIPQISNEIHLPVQSGSNAILTAMKRNYTREEYALIAKDLRKAIPNLALSTDFIVGFPGETDDDFAETLSLAEEINFSMAYCFKYSPRAGTESAKRPDDVPEELKEARLARLLAKMDSLRDKERSPKQVSAL